MNRHLRTLMVLPVLTILSAACGGGGGGGGGGGADAPPTPPGSSGPLGPVEMVANLERDPGSGIGSYPSTEHHATFDGGVFMVLDTPETGYELFRTDGTEAGTTLVKDIVPGSGSSRPEDLTAAGRNLFFTAEDELGRELWVTDGTSQGTRRVADFAQGPDGAPLLEILGALGDQVFLSIFDRDSGVGTELFMSEGTAIRLLRDIRVGPGGSDPEPGVAFKGLFYFSAETSSGKRELWVTDGTTAGTVAGSGIATSENLTDPAGFLACGSYMCFAARDATVGRELYLANEGFVFNRVDIEPGVGSSSPQPMWDVGNGVMVFAATVSATGRELCAWKINEPVRVIADIRPGPEGSNPDHAFVHRGLLYFEANDGTTGRELWRTDGTAAGTIRLADIEPGSKSSSPRPVEGLGDNLLFTASGPLGREPWVTDGTPAGTQLYADLAPGTSATTGRHYGSQPQLLGRIGDTVIASVQGRLRGNEPWALTPNSRRPINVVPDTERGSFPSDFARVGDQVFFSASTLATGSELWVTDGTEAGTRLVADLELGPKSSGPQFVTAVGNRVVFAAGLESVGRELFVSDGTPSGTRLLLDISPGSSSVLLNFTPFGDKVLFTAYQDTAGDELWITDGTPSGTRMVRDLNPDGGSSPSQLTPFDGKMFFLAYDEDGRGVYATDGTAAGTTRVFSAQVAQLLGVANGLLLFTASTERGGQQEDLFLYRTDGTPAGTARVNPSRATGQGTTIAVAELPGLLAYSSFADPGLWVTDGTAAGTRQIAAAEGLGAGSMFIGGFAYFAAAASGEDYELWRTDGTAAGTTLVEELFPGPVGSRPQEFLAIGDRGYFLASDLENGHELWTVDASGEVALRHDFFPGRANGIEGRRGVAVLGDALIIAADDGERGRELHRVPLR